MKLILAVAASLAATPCLAGQQMFDLDCSGAEVTFGSTEQKVETRRYTVDLASKRWCRTNECAEALPIERVTADEITFIRSPPSASIEHRHFISRISGEYVETVIGAGPGSRSTGSCKPAKFSGFPKAKF